MKTGTLMKTYVIYNSIDVDCSSDYFSLIYIYIKLRGLGLL